MTAFSAGRRWALGLAAIVVVGAGSVARADKYKDEDLGFSLNVPGKWEKMMLSPDTRWVVARFNCNREYEFSDSKTRSWARQRPFLDVVVLPKAVIDADRKKVEKTDTGVRINEDIPFKDIREYLDQTWQQRQGGFFFSQEEAAEVNGMKVRMFELTINKLVDAERRVWCWEFETEDALWGVISEVLHAHEDKLKDDILKSFKSFTTFQRKGSLPQVDITGTEISLEDKTKEEEKEVSPDDKKAQREASFRRQLNQNDEHFPKDWIRMESENFAAFSHTDKKHTKEMLDHAEALRAWLDEKLGYVGATPAGKVILLICRDYEEAQGVYGTWSKDKVQVTITKQTDPEVEFRTLNYGVYNQWVRDKNSRIGWGSPPIVSRGLFDLIASARSKGRKVEFKPMGWDREAVKAMEREGKIVPAKSWFTMGREELYGTEGTSQQAEYIARFLLQGKGSKTSKYKTLFGDFLKNVLLVMDEMQAEADAAKADGGEAEKEPQSEEEEAAMTAALQNQWKDRERELIDRAVSRTFEGWTDSDWDKLNAAYLKDL